MPSAPVADIDFGSPDFLCDPWTPLRQLQDQDPIFWSETQKAWIVTRHADVITTFRDPRLSASRIVPFLETVPGGLGDDFPLIRHFEEKWISNVDAPIHSRLRKLMLNAFSKSVVESLRPSAHGVSQDILEEVEGREVDYVLDVARQVPARVITAMFGIPADRREQFASWAGDIQQATGAAVLDRAMIEKYHTTLVEMNVALRELIAERRLAPKEDLLSQFIQARDANDKLTEDELLGACHATIIAGFETTMHMLVLGMIELAERPSLQEYLLASPQQASKAVDELLRYIGMAKGMLRIAKEDFEWHGKQIHSGDFVFGMNISANRDERVWKDPDSIDPDRDNMRSAAFGPGMHFCLGHLLAKMELAEFFTELFGNYKIEILSDERTWINSFTFRGLEHLPVRITRKA
jgi:pimeloyl-[acyl-carrier protein] synthase